MTTRRTPPAPKSAGAVAAKLQSIKSKAPAKPPLAKPKLKAGTPRPKKGK